MIMPLTEYDRIGEELSDRYGVTISRMFGKPCLKINNKAFCCFFNDEMVFKIGQGEAANLNSKYPGSKNFDPSGKSRPMKAWLQVPVEFKNEWQKLSEQALRFVEENK